MKWMNHAAFQVALGGLLAIAIGYLFEGGEYGAFWACTGLAIVASVLPLFLPRRHVLIWYLPLTAAIMFGFMIGFWSGRSVRYQRLEFFDMHAVIRWSVTVLPALMGAGGTLAYFANRSGHRRRREGPYCRGCGYHLVGVSERRCPECGRGFTPEELGIDPVELEAPSDEG